MAPVSSIQLGSLAAAVIAGCFVGTVFAEVRVGSLAVAAGHNVPAVTLRQAADSAWQRSVEAIESSGQADLAKVESQVFQAWFASPPSVSVAQREPVTAVLGGARETSLGWVFPIWRSAYRQSGEAASAAEIELRQMAERALRLQLAGRVRTFASAARLADIELKESQRHVANLTQIAADVGRRVDAGDLAPADRMAAEAERLAALVQLNAAEVAAKVQLSVWRLLTGLAQLPDPESAEAPPDPPHDARMFDQHPERLLSIARVEWAQRRVALAQLRPAAAPEIGLTLRQDQPLNEGSGRSSVALSLRIPVGGEPYLKPGVTAAIGARATAEVQAARTAERLASELMLARDRLDLEASQSRSAKERADLLAERARLIEKSFRAGESSLTELLRAFALQGESALALARRQELFNFARAQVNQALGVMP